MALHKYFKFNEYYFIWVRRELLRILIKVDKFIKLNYD